MEPLPHYDRNRSGELPPRDAWLTAYLDGELGPEERARVEAWLAQDPAGRARARDERQVRALFGDAHVPEPDPAAWDRALAGIAAGLAAPRTEPDRHRPQPSLRLRTVAVWLTAAAAVLAGVWLGAGLLSGPPVKPTQPVADAPEAEVFAVADVTINDMDPLDAPMLVVGEVPHDLPSDLLAGEPLALANLDSVEIISMDGSDTTGVLVIGDPPVAGPLVLARPGEVKVDHIAGPGSDDSRAYFHEEGGGMPMIMVPVKFVRGSRD